LLFRITNGKSAKLDHLGFGRLHFEAKFPQPHHQFFPKPLCIHFVLEADNEIIAESIWA